MRQIDAELLPVPGIVLGPYPERRAEGRPRKAAQRARLFAWPHDAAHPYRHFVQTVAALDAATGALDRVAIGERLRATRAAMARDRLTDGLIAEAFMLVTRTCAMELGVELFPNQLMAARIMLDRRLAEMATGEGKTLAAAVCAATAALAGIPVHVITANDYLVTRDAESLRPLYGALGLSVASITQSLDADARRKAYDCDIVYSTASEIAFDYLRDGLVRGGSRSDWRERMNGLPAARRTVLRGLCMAIVDEADSILIDEARVPLVLSERCSNGRERRYLDEALEFAGRLAPHAHYVLHASRMCAELTGAGRDLLERIAPDGLWRNRLHREETVCTALAALHLYERDRHYLVRDGTVAIIDESTGRVAPGRIWSHGLHRMIELKERCENAGDTATLAQITYQRFFQRYLALAGMSGTLAEARAELRSVYGLSVVRVPLHRPDRRRVLPGRVFPEREALWNAAVAEAVEMSRTGRPVLIGTDSVTESEALSQRLAAAGVPHAVLNARQDGDEAQIVARAGEPGRITVATNMAGRGTDIALAAGVAEAGGLHVICCQHNASRRIDRQLLGRCARRGDPGSARVLLALDKPLIAPFAPRWLRRAAEGGLERPQWLVRLVARAPQWLEERRARVERRALLRQDVRAADQLSFARPME